MIIMAERQQTERRTIVRVTGITSEYVYVTIPLWNSYEPVKVPKVSLPSDLRENLATGQRLHVYANLNAYEHDDLNFSRWSAG